MNILVLNSGSSSLKFELIATDLDRMREDRDERLFRGLVERIGGDAVITIHLRSAQQQKFTAPVRDTADALKRVTDWLMSSEAKDSGLTSLSDVHAVGHRVVHGGELFSESAVIDDEVMRGIEQCINLAPLHNPNNLKGVFAAQQLFGPDVPNVAVFDTAFHQTMPPCAYLYALPYHLYRRYKVRRYGFHGTSHRYVAYRYRMLLKLSREETNLITLHLGNGCSAAAILRGCSVDTSMGMTPLEGLVMGSRSGDIDPSIVDFIARNENLTTHQVEGILNTQSGLLGISGVTNDMRELQGLAFRADDQRAQLAIDMFCYRARKYIGAFLAAMGGADAVVFTGGIGENSPEIRARICDQLGWAGLNIDRSRNEQAKGTTAKISTDESRLAAYCIPTDEELIIARDTLRCVQGVPHPS